MPPPPPKKPRNLLRMAVTLGVRVGGSLAVFALTVFLARTIGADETGKFLWAQTILLGVSTAARLGLDVTMLRLVSPAWEKGEKPRIRGLLRQTLQAVTAAGAVAAVLGLAGMFLFAEAFPDAGYRRLFAVSMAALIPFTLAFPVSAILKGMRMPEFAALIERSGLPVLALGLAAAAFVVFEPTALTALLAYGAAAAVMLAAGLLAVTRKTAAPGPVTKAPWPDIRRSAAPVVMLTLAGFLTTWWCGIVLAWYAPPADVGIFNVAQRVSNIIGLVLVAFISVYSPRFPGLYERGALDQLEKLVKRGTRTMLAAAMPLILVALLAPRWVLSIFGPEFVEGEWILIALVLGQFVNVASGTVGLLLMLSGHEKVMRNISVAVSLVIVGLSVPIVATWGAVGAAAWTACGVALQNGAASYMVKRKLKISAWPW